MNQTTGKIITGLDELWQRINRLLQTRKGTLVGRRGYGSELPELIDNNMSPSFVLDIYAATAEAIIDPENGIDDFTLTRTDLETTENGVTLYLIGEFDSELVTLKGVDL